MRLIILLFSLLLTILCNRDLNLCRKFAQRHFMNTCKEAPGHPASSLNNMKSSKVYCYKASACVNEVWNSPRKCVFHRKLCVSCYQKDKEVKIRVQSNGLPHHCWGAKKAIKEMKIDFEVNWNTLTKKTGLNTMIYGQLEVNNTLCSPLAHRNINLPDYVKFRNFGSYPLNLVSGVAKNGVLIFSPVGFRGHKDAFDNPDELTNLDECLGNIAPKGYYFYRSVSPCLYTDKIKGQRLCNGKCDPHKEMRRFMPRHQSAMGIAKDGRAILTPYKSRRLRWGNKGVDVCNLSQINVRARPLFGVKKIRYSMSVYIASFHFPYISGCFGAGSYPLERPTCTTHPISKYTQLKSELKG